MSLFSVSINTYLSVSFRNSFTYIDIDTTYICNIYMQHICIMDTKTIENVWYWYLAGSLGQQAVWDWRKTGWGKRVSVGHRAGLVSWGWYGNWFSQDYYQSKHYLTYCLSSSFKFINHSLKWIFLKIKLHSFHIDVAKSHLLIANSNCCALKGDLGSGRSLFGYWICIGGTLHGTGYEFASGGRAQLACPPFPFIEIRPTA